MDLFIECHINFSVLQNEATRHVCCDLSNYKNIIMKAGPR